MEHHKANIKHKKENKHLLSCKSSKEIKHKLKKDYELLIRKLTQ